MGKATLKSLRNIITRFKFCALLSFYKYIILNFLQILNTEYLIKYEKSRPFRRQISFDLLLSEYDVSADCKNEIKHKQNNADYSPSLALTASV